MPDDQYSGKNLQNDSGILSPIERNQPSLQA